MTELDAFLLVFIEFDHFEKGALADMEFSHRARLTDNVC